MPKASLPGDVVQRLTGQNTADLIPQMIAFFTRRGTVGMHVQFQSAAIKRFRQERFRHDSGRIHARGLETIPHPVQQLFAGPIGLLTRHEEARLPCVVSRMSTR